MDAANCVYRAFFAPYPPLRTSKGFPTKAVLGFTQMLRKVLREEAPTRVAVVFDARGKSFRHELFSEYKATRDAQPEELSQQFPVVREVVEAHGLPILEVEGVEADDVIATLVGAAPPQTHVTIVSTDKDLMQLVGERVNLLDTMKDRRFGSDEVEARFGVPPAQLLDLRALVGDTSDNIPGVRGIGEKGAAGLIREWGTLDALLEHAGEVKAKRAREALESQADQARLSRDLARLRVDVTLPLSFDELRPGTPDLERLREIFQRLEFTRLLEALDAGSGASAPAASPSEEVETRVVAAALELAALVAELAAQDRVVLECVGVLESPLREEPVGLAFALGDDRAVYLPVGEARLDRPSLRLSETLAELAPLLVPDGASARPWLARGAKDVQTLFAEHGVEISLPLFDPEIAGFLIDPAAPRTPTALAARFLDESLPAWEEIAGRGAKAVPPADLPLETISSWAGHQVTTMARLVPPLAERLEKDGLSPLYREVELALTPVLSRMERAGVRVDESVLHELSVEYRKELDGIEARVYELAGETFQIASPKQLQRILFEKLKLPVVRKTKTGYSTDESVLEQLEHHHELPRWILAHRRLTKLKNTYVDALPPLINPTSGRIHPTFHQTGAATGRLSATNPNVQNIPIRTEEGVRIREAFVPAEGRRLVSADYSQVELRILAHYSGDESLVEAFRTEADVHRRTAADVLGIDPEDVSPEQRARAKAINFGIIYGSTAFGIANQLGIASAEAQATIDAYFERYQGVRRFLDETIAGAREQGFVTTFLGRRRYLPDLGSRNRVQRQAAERMAVNTVIQGSAADLIKKAMVGVDRRLRREARESRMILQVHDELVFEAPEAEVEGLSAGAREVMESVFQLRVPLRVDVGVGRSWREAH
ncbi:MAG: DNA polymerase I [Myxococcota bacterium]